MMLKIAELIPEEYRGVYAGRKPDPDLYQDLQPGEG
jgi:hypothetical protein